MTNRTGAVPAGTMLFISLVAFETSSREGYGETEAELRAAAASVVDLVTDLSCEADGMPVHGLSSFRFASDTMCSLAVPEDNIFDLRGVKTPVGTCHLTVIGGGHRVHPQS